MPGAKDYDYYASNAAYNILNDANNTRNVMAANNVGGSFVSDAGTFVLSEIALDMHCWGENPVITAKLQLNGQDRISEREGAYFDVVQPFQHHSRSPDTGINVYSSALKPEEQ
jgi:Large eukaryotic DNA virus major capsid protein